jgi:prepilin-type N-terminal cleavage/methylation domain-containing protein
VYALISKKINGFTMVEILVATVLLGLAATALMAVSEQFIQKAAYEREQAELKSIESMISDRVIKSNSCKISLQFFPATSAAALAAAAVAGNSAFAVSLLVDMPGSAQFLLKNNVNFMSYNINTLELINVRVFNPLLSQYIGLLRLKVDRIKNVGIGPKTLAPRIISPVVFTIDGAGQVSDCFTQVVDTADCAALGGVYDPSLNPPCRMVRANISCPPGQLILGIQNGSAVCSGPLNIQCPVGQYIVGFNQGQPLCGQ